MKTSRRRWGVAAALGPVLIAAVADGCQLAETESERASSLLIVVSSDVPDDLFDAVRVEAAAGGRTRVWPASQAPPQRPPFSVTLSPADLAPGPIDVTAQLVKSSGELVMEERADDIQFVIGQQLVLELALDKSCLRTACPSDTMTCHLGVCRDADKPTPDQLFAITDGDQQPPTKGYPDAGPRVAPGDGGATDLAGNNGDSGDAAADGGPPGGNDAAGDGGPVERPAAGGPCADDSTCPGDLFCVGGHCGGRPPPDSTSDTFDRYCVMPYVPQCAPAVDEPFTAARKVAVAVSYRASPSLGVAITVSAWLDADSNHAVQSKMLQPGDVTGPLPLGITSAGPHTVHLQPTGTRALSEWKGSVEISTIWAR